MKFVSGVLKHQLNWHCAIAMFCALVMCSAAFAGSKLGSNPSNALALSSSDRAAGTKTFEAEDFVLLSNSSGELRLAVVGFRDRPIDSQQGMRFVFDDFVNEPLHIVLSESSHGLVKLTLAVPGFPAVEFEKRPGESFLRTDGLLVPHSAAHRDQMFKHGIHTGRIEDFMKLKVNPKLLGALMRFQQFAEQLELKALIDASESPKILDDWLQAHAALCGELSEGSQSADSGIQSWSCIAELLNLSSSVLSFMSGAQSCLSCRVTRKQEECYQCAALIGAGTSSLILALVECFGEGPEPEPTPPPPPPAPPTGGNLPTPFPYPGPGGGMMVPITYTETFTVCVDGVCWTETRTVTVWILVR